MSGENAASSVKERTRARSLAEMRPDDEAVVLSVEGTEHESRRLIDLGLVPGTPVRALRCAPLRDPIAFRFRDTTLCLRREQAKLVRVL